MKCSAIGMPKSLAGWYYGQRQIRTYLKGDGLTKETEPLIRQHYLDLLDNMSLILDEQPYLLGSRPTLVDFGLFGPMFRHYALDPTPAKVMSERAPAVYEWVARVWNARASKMPPQQVIADFSHPGWQFFLKDIVQTYWPFLLRTAEAWQAGKSRVDHEVNGVVFRDLKVVHYRVFCLELLQRAYAELPQPARTHVDETLAPYGKLPMIDGLDSGLMEEHELPLKDKNRDVSFGKKLLLMVTGTPWDMPKRAR